MTYEVKIPDLGESVLTATLVHWLKQAGDAVSIGDALAELETDKVDVEVAAPHDGVLAEIRVAEGDDVAVGDVIAVISEPAESAEARPEPQPAEAAATTATPAADQSPLEPQPAAPATDQPPPHQLPAAAITPVARRVAQEQGVDPGQIAAAGKAGRITRQDVEAYVAQQQPPPEAAPRERAPAPARAEQPEQPASRPEERVRMSRRRQTIAQRLVEAQHTAAMLTTFNELDMGAVMDLRRRQKAHFQERHGVGLGIVSFFVKASVVALQDFPRLNAEVRGDEMILKRYYDIGVAIGAEEGLVVPVLRDVDAMTFGDIEQAVAALVEKTRTGALTLDDLRGGTFTITNGGVFGSLLSTPILNPPQVGILGLHKIEDRPVAVEGAVVVRPMMYMALSYDHRIVDGREAVQFLARIKTLVEDPGSLLLEM